MNGNCLKAKRLFNATVVLEMSLDMIEIAMESDESLANTIGDRHQFDTFVKARGLFKELRDAARRIDRTITIDDEPERCACCDKYLLVEQ